MCREPPNGTTKELGCGEPPLALYLCSCAPNPPCTETGVKRGDPRRRPGTQLPSREPCITPRNLDPSHKTWHGGDPMQGNTPSLQPWDPRTPSSTLATAKAGPRTPRGTRPLNGHHPRGGSFPTATGGSSNRPRGHGEGGVQRAHRPSSPMVPELHPHGER